MGDVIQFAPPPPEYDGMTCSGCGSAWFTVQAVALDQDAKITAYSAPLTCRECGQVRVSGAWVPPDLSEVKVPINEAQALRERIEQIVNQLGGLAPADESEAEVQQAFVMSLRAALDLPFDLVIRPGTSAGGEGS